jgi:von Willebrand factor type A domain
MELTFLTPLASIFAASVLLPLLVSLVRARHVGRIRAALHLDAQRLGLRLPLLLAVAAVPVLLGIAAAQPVLGTERSIPERADAQAFFVLDTSRSMLAAAGPAAPTRFERAQRVASALRDRIPQVPVGLVSMTDRILPHAFPTTDRRVFETTLHRSIGVEQPPPAFTYSTYATSYDVLAGIPERHYFTKQAKKRVLVVLTDGESRPLVTDLAHAFDVKPPIKTVFVRFWSAGERIYETGVTEGGYLPDRHSAAMLEHVASLVDGRVFSEQQATAAGDEIARLVGNGQTRNRTIAGARLALMPYVTLLAFLPLTFLLWRRNR